MPDFPDLSWDSIPLGPFDTRLWWLLIALCVALLFTVQAVEAAVDGTWPHQRRPTRIVPRARVVQTSWGVVALLVLPGALLAIGVVAALIWQDADNPEQLTLGSVLVAIGWLLFLAFSLDFLRLGRLMGNLGIIGPLAIMVILIVGDILLLIALLDILPEWDTVWDAIENGLRDVLPFIE